MSRPKMRTVRRERQSGDPHSPLWVADLMVRRGFTTALDLHERVAEWFVNTGTPSSEPAIIARGGLALYPSLLRVVGLSSVRAVDGDDILEAVPTGLCGDLRDHEPHLEDSLTLGLFWCHADQSRRLF